MPCNRYVRPAELPTAVCKTTPPACLRFAEGGLLRVGAALRLRGHRSLLRSALLVQPGRCLCLQMQSQAQGSFIFTCSRCSAAC